MVSGIDYLQKLGLTLYQAKAVTLLFKRDATANDISRLMDIPLSKLYQVLGSLEDRGIIVERSESRPYTYGKLSAKRTINKLLTRKQKEVERLCREKEEYIEFLADLRFQVRARKCPAGIHDLGPGEFCFCSKTEKGVIGNAYK